jgi:hypothetical protein
MTVQLQAEDQLAADQAAATEKDKLLLREHLVKDFQAAQRLKAAFITQAVVAVQVDLAQQLLLIPVAAAQAELV